MINLTPNLIEIIPARDKIQRPVNTDSFDLSQLFGGWRSTQSEFRKGSLNIKANEEQILAGSATAPLTGAGIFFGKDGANYEFRAGDPAGNYLHYDGTDLNIQGGTITAGSITIGTNAWHVDTSGNMWWGSAASYALATIKISSVGSIDFTTGTFSGDIVTASIKTASSGSRIEIGVTATNTMDIYSSSSHNSRLIGLDNEFRLLMLQNGGYITLQVNNDAGATTEVLRADGDAGVSVSSSLPLNAFNVVITKTGTGATIPLNIINSGAETSLLIAQNYVSNTLPAVDITNAGSGTVLKVTSTSTASATAAVFYAKGTNGVVQVIAQSNVSNTFPALYIETISGQGAHLHLEPIVTAPSTPSEGDIYADTDNKLYYYNGTAWKEFAFV